MTTLLARLLIGSIHAYQLALRPLFGGSCRFVPSCSHYAIEAIQRHGPLRGLSLSIRRLVRCHPLHAAGYDPVPPGDIG